MSVFQDNSTGQATGASPSTPNVFQSYFNDASTSDITVKAGEVKIHAHKIALIAHSALFRAMFQVKPLSNCLATHRSMSDDDISCSLARKRTQLRR